MIELSIIISQETNLEKYIYFIDEVAGNNEAGRKSCRRQKPKTLIYMEWLQESVELWFLISEVCLQWGGRALFIGRTSAWIREGLEILPLEEFNSYLISSIEILDFFLKIIIDLDVSDFLEKSLH